MTSDGLDAARALLPGFRLTLVASLGAGERSTVCRVHAQAPDGTESSLIVKQYVGEHDGWLRETAALASVPGAVRAPRPLVTGDSPRVLITEDFGDGPSVADALLGDDPRAAADAVVGWAEAIAELHVATAGSRDAFRAELAQRSGGADVDESWIPGGLDDAERVLDRDCGSLGVALPAGALQELTGLVARLNGDGPAALTPADACPDNNVRVGDQRVLIDFEDAQWRHLAWDVAYLQVPWPTCWCSWWLPDDVAVRATDAYCRIAASAFPEVTGERFARDVEAAAVGWSFMSAAWSLDHALAGENDLDLARDPARPGPPRRATILHRLDLAARSPELPALAELAADLGGELHRRWGDVSLPPAPAFRTG